MESTHLDPATDTTSAEGESTNNTSVSSIEIEEDYTKEEIDKAEAFKDQGNALFKGRHDML
jgi:hypothetical protein